ncbi:auxin response factor 2 isoform X3 [Nicotiana tabacum]|uniref:Auxin response factor 2 isoform X3 n=1 Tax=Nicotiana tabacum TaxID=4097 RepID=A0AC58T9L6_TOBAC
MGNDDKGRNSGLHRELWLACSGPLVIVPSSGDMVFYYPQGHIEQIEACMNEDGLMPMPAYNVPYKILCRVVSVRLQAEANTDEVFAEITLLPHLGTREPILAERSPLFSRAKTDVHTYSKKLTPSDVNTHGGLSIPKQLADECFPPLNNDQDFPAQDLVAKDLNGLEWKFRHVYRGQSRRHLIRNGWSRFVSAKKLVAGDTLIFVRGKNYELYVAVRRAKKQQTSSSTSILSSHYMQHGMLSNAYHAVSSGTMFTIYYRPWTCPAAFIIPYNQYMKASEIDYEVGMTFNMPFESHELDCGRTVCPIFSGTIVDVKDFDPIRWPGSDWRCLKVKWNHAKLMPVRPERVSPWSIVAIGITKRKRRSFSSYPSKAQPLDPANPFGVKDCLMKSSVEHSPPWNSRVLQGQEKAVNAYEENAFRRPHDLRQPPQRKLRWRRGQVRLENQQHNHILDPWLDFIGKEVHGTSPSSNGFSNLQSSKIPSFASESLSIPKIVDYRNSNSKGNVESDVMGSQPTGGSKLKLFGVDILNGPESPSQHGSKLTHFGSFPAASKTVNFLEQSKSTSGNSDTQCSRSCTKVLKYGCALGRSIDMSRVKGYGELISELDKLFGFEGSLLDGSKDWHVTYQDREGNTKLLGDYPWSDFQAMVRKMFICPIGADYLADRSF